VAALVLLLSFTGCEEEESAPAPTAQFTVAPESALQQGEEVIFNNQSKDAFSYLWSFGDGQTFIGEDATHVYDAPGDYEVTLEASGNGKRSLFSTTITIEGLIPQTLFEVENEDNLKVGIPVMFINNTVNALSFKWSFGDDDNSTSTEAEPVFTYDSPGDYTVTLTATGTGGSSNFEKTITVNPNQFELYYIDNDALKLRKVKLSDPDNPEDVFDLPGFCFGLAYDAENDHVYYTDDDAKKLYRNNLQGTNEEEIAGGFSDPRDIALDTVNDLAYVTDRGSDEVIQVDLNTLSTTTVYSSTDDADFLIPVGIDLHNNALFMTAVEIGAETIWTGNVDGSGITRIIDFSAGGYGYGVEIDKVNDKIYFDDTDTGSIIMANLDGSGIETVGSTTDRVYGIAINNESGKVYWADRSGLISFANLDGSGEDVLVDLAVDIRGMIIRKTN